MLNCFAFPFKQGGEEGRIEMGEGKDMEGGRTQKYVKVQNKEKERKHEHNEGREQVSTRRRIADQWQKGDALEGQAGTLREHVSSEKKLIGNKEVIVEED